MTNSDSLIDIGGRRQSKRYVKTKGGAKVPLHSIIEMNLADKQKISVLKRQENYNLVKSEESLQKLVEQDQIMEMATGADTQGEDDERLAQDTGRYYEKLDHEMDASDLH